MAINPIIFDLKYTPYRLKRGATDDEILAHADERAFYDMSGGKNILGYMTTEGKLGEERKDKFTNLEYLQKSTGVFNQDGMISPEELEQIIERAKNNKGNIWHGFISLHEEDSPKIDTPEKCIELVKRSFNSFFKEGHFNKKNMDLICALHLDKPHHLHIHFTFFEREPKFKTKDGEKVYRAKGKIDKKAIDNMYVRVAEFIAEDKSALHTRRDDAVKSLREATSFREINAGSEEILQEIIELSKVLPKTGRLSYASKEMEPYRGRVDNIVKMLIDKNGQAQAADTRFYEALEKRKKLVSEVCKTPHKYSEENVKIEDMATKPDYRYNIDESNITLIKDIEDDYKRRQGNLVIKLAKAIKVEYYERSKKQKYKANSKWLKKRLTISGRKVKRLFDNFFLSFGGEHHLLERDFNDRLQQIEEEMENEREKQNNKKEGNKKD